MAENGEAATETKEPPKMQILGQFIRDMSFENIVAQKGISGEIKPDVNVQVALDAKKRPTENQYEVGCKFSVTSKNKDSDATLFMMELDYVGVFHIENIPEAQLHPFLMIECPRMLFPFVRRIISDVTRDGGFPPLNVENIDFIKLYRQTVAQRAQAEKENQPVS